MNKLSRKYQSPNEYIEYFISEYSKKEQPIEICFKELLPELKNIDRFTHLIHTYPAKLLVHIPYFFLNNDIFSNYNDTVLDPFCGTGTVLLESIISGRNAYGADANPLARLIAKVKVEHYDIELLENILKSILKFSKNFRSAPIPNVINRDYWFPLNTQKQLAKLLMAIKTVEDEKYRDFFLVCFSNCIKKVSYADPRISVPVKLNPNRFEEGCKRNLEILNKLNALDTCDVNEKFRHICIENIHRFSLFNNSNSYAKASIISADARRLTDGIISRNELKSESVNLIITSPPYAGAQKYIRSSSLNLGWLELAEPEKLKELDSLNIGRENYLKKELEEIYTGIKSADQLISKLTLINKERAYIVANYLSEMKEAMKESIRVLKRGGFLILIIGNNKVCNFEFNTQQYLTDFLVQDCQLKLIFKLIDDIKSYGLMTKRNKTADIISREWILVFKK